MTAGSLRLATAFPIFALFAASAAADVDFKKDVMPIFKKRCVECHSSTMKKPKGGYKFDTPEEVGKEIGSSFLIRPGDPGNSDLMAKVNRSDKHKMPPEDSDALTPKELKTLSQWIMEGANLEPAKSTASSGLPARPDAAKPAPVLDWTNNQNKTIKASFVKLDNGKVTLKMGNGRTYDVALDTLTESSQKQAQEQLQAKASAAVRP